MKMLVAGVVFATLVASPAFAQSHDRNIAVGWNDTDSNPWNAARVAPYGARSRSPYAAYNAVTPFGSPAFLRDGGKIRPAAIHLCSVSAQKYTEHSWGDMEFQQYRACMAVNGQVE